MLRLSLLIFIVVLSSQVYAQSIYCEQHNLSYFLDDSIKVKESLKLVQKPFSNKQPLVYPLPEDAQQIEVYVPRGVKYTLDFENKKILFDFFNYPRTFINIKIGYVRTSSIFEKYGEKSFSGITLPRYAPWITYATRVEFILPPGYSFGSFSPPGKLENSSLIYDLSLRFNFTTINSGFPVEIVYADYEKLAEEKISLAKSMETSALLAFKDANESLKDAKDYNLSLREVLERYSDAEKELRSYIQEIKWAETLMSARYRDYYQAYQHAKKAVAHLENVSILSREVSRDVSRLIREHLESRIAKIANISRQVEVKEKSEEKPENYTKPVIKSEVEIKGEEKEKTRNLPIVPISALGFLVLVIIFAYTRREKHAYPTRPGKMRYYRSISDLKRKKFSGFDKKIERVKESVEITAEIRRLEKLRGKYILGIENLNKKLAQGEIDEEDFKNERLRLEKEIEKIDMEISRLNKKLSDIKGKRNEKSK